ncbi:MAG TPA: BON domain-containing protein [Terriglobia bacterium]|nr:BON domain-containing protein [Terriglobia bacterium]
MPRPQLRLVILTVMGVLLLGACNSFKPFQSTDDKTITTSIQAKLFNDPVLKTRDIRVDSRNGIVTLSGTVNTDLEKAAVERIAAQEDGVKNVVNMLGVATTSATPAPEVAQTTENAAPPQEVAPSPAPPAQPAPEKRSHKRQAQPASHEKKASAALHAYTESVAPETGANAAPAPAPTPTPAVATPAPAAPPPVATAPAAPAPPPPAPAPAPKPQERLTIPEGTVVTIRMVDSIDSSRNKPGEEFAATLDSPIVVGDRAVASRGADARVRLVTAKSAGHIEGQSQLQLELINVTINGVPYETHSGYYEQHGASRGTRSAETIGGGAVLGALLGGIFGHGKGAAIGSIAGAGAGTAVQVSTKGQQVKVPSETKLDFTLKDPVTVAMGGND